MEFAIIAFAALYVSAKTAYNNATNSALKLASASEIGIGKSTFSDGSTLEITTITPNTVTFIFTGTNVDAGSFNFIYGKAFDSVWSVVDTLESGVPYTFTYNNPKPTTGMYVILYAENTVLSRYSRIFKAV